MAAMTESLRQKQSRFVLMISKLIQYAYANGYELTFGEAYRTPEQAALNAKKGTGIANSLHVDRLAVDFNLFKGGKFLSRTEDHAFLGNQWEEMGGTWGGRFKDGNHYSLAHGGRK